MAHDPLLDEDPTKVPDPPDFTKFTPEAHGKLVHPRLDSMPQGKAESPRPVLATLDELRDVLRRLPFRETMEFAASLAETDSGEETRSLAEAIVAFCEAE